MKSPRTHDIEPLDHRSSRSICDAVGERLQQVLRPEAAGTSARLEQLLDELRRRDEADRLKSH